MEVPKGVLTKETATGIIPPVAVFSNKAFVRSVSASELPDQREQREIHRDDDRADRNT